jgi:hypothetical protein
MMKQSNDEEALSRSAVFKWHKRSAQRRDNLDVMNVPIDQDQPELNSVSASVSVNRSQTVDEVTTSAGINYATCHKISV